MINKCSFFIIIFLSVFFSSCIGKKNIKGSFYSYDQEYLGRSIYFKNDSICELKYKIKCEDINPSYKQVTIYSLYKVENEKVILRNLECSEESNCKFEMFIDIPVQESKCCSFLNEEGRGNVNKQVVLGSSYISDYEQNLTMLNIDVDTLYLYKNENKQYIILEKNDSKVNRFISMAFEKKIRCSR